MKTLIGISTFGNLPFTQLTINAIRNSTTEPIDFFVVVGKPGDLQTSAWLSRQRIAHVQRDENLGFAAALNEIMDYAWRSPLQAHPGLQLPDVRPAGGYERLIIAGNDVVAYPGAIDSLIYTARETEWEWICSSQFDVKSLIQHYPNTAQYFEGPTLNFNRWNAADDAGVMYYEPQLDARPWLLHADKVPLPCSAGIHADCISDVRNLCLFKRSVFEKIGYADVNFWPGGYFEDNDYCTRARRGGVKACRLAHSAYFHFWSRTIHQGEGTSSRQFQNNAHFYESKWGGPFDGERWNVPFDGREHKLCANVALPGSLRIENRQNEAAIVEYWKGR